MTSRERSGDDIPTATIRGVPSQPVPIRLDLGLIAQIDELAVLEDRPRASMIRRLLGEAIAARKAQNGRPAGPS
jgi:hypothetical protein